MTRSQFLKLSALAVGGAWGSGRAWADASFWDGAARPSCPDPAEGLAAELGKIPRGDYPRAFVFHGPRLGRKVALTFDDGPKPGNTERVMETLARFNAKGTFFLIGRNVKAYPRIVQELHAAGHEVANHSFTHPKLSAMSSPAVSLQLSQTQNAIFDACGFRPVMFRPPYGAFTVSQKPLATELGLSVVIWSVDPNDWRDRNTDTVTRRVLGGTRWPGDIILTHDIHATTVAAIPAIVEGLTQRGFELVTMSELMAGQPALVPAAVEAAKTSPGGA